MPLYEYRCDCGMELEQFQSMWGPPPICGCGKVMKKGAGSISVLKIDGMFPSRREWMDNYTPNSKPFSTGSHHGARY